MLGAHFGPLFLSHAPPVKMTHAIERRCLFSMSPALAGQSPRFHETIRTPILSGMLAQLPTRALRLTRGSSPRSVRPRCRPPFLAAESAHEHDHGTIRTPKTTHESPRVKPFSGRLVGSTSRPRLARPGPLCAVFFCTVRPEASGSNRSPPDLIPNLTNKARAPRVTIPLCMLGGGPTMQSRYHSVWRLVALDETACPYRAPREGSERLELLGPATDPPREKRIRAAAQGAFHRKTTLSDRWKPYSIRGGNHG